MAQYTHTTLAAARTALQLRLQDTGAVYWTVAELNAYIVEALRTWQALTGFYRDRGTLSTVANTQSYDLSAALSASLFGYNVTDTSLFTLICSHLLEPASVPYIGTDQFTQAQILNAIQARRDQFLLDTAAVISRIVLASGAAPVSRVGLPDNVIDVRRAAWIDQSSLYTTLWRDDEQSAFAFQPGWLTPAQVPNSYSVAVVPPVGIQVIPISTNTGQMEILSVTAGAALALLPSLLNIPDDFAYGIKFGAIADLLRADGQDRDPLRAQYCEQRYQECVTAARLNPSVMQAEIGTSILPVGSLLDEDAYNASWQNATPAQPTRGAMAGRNLLYFVNTPDNVYSVTLDLVRNMIVPSLDTDYLQVGREQLDVILDYSQHLACFKMGGQEFVQTQVLYQNLMREAMITNNRLNASIFLRRIMEQPAQQQERMVPRLIPSPEPLNLNRT